MWSWIGHPLHLQQIGLPEIGQPAAASLAPWDVAGLWDLVRRAYQGGSHEVQLDWQPPESLMVLDAEHHRVVLTALTSLLSLPTLRSFTLHCSHPVILGTVLPMPQPRRPNPFVALSLDVLFDHNALQWFLQSLGTGLRFLLLHAPGETPPLRFSLPVLQSLVVDGLNPGSRTWQDLIHALSGGGALRNLAVSLTSLNSNSFNNILTTAGSCEGLQTLVVVVAVAHNNVRPLFDVAHWSALKTLPQLVLDVRAASNGLLNQDLPLLLHRMLRPNGRVQSITIWCRMSGTQPLERSIECLSQDGSSISQMRSLMLTSGRDILRECASDWRRAALRHDTSPLDRGTGAPPR